MPHVKFNDAGKWAEAKSYDPQFEVEAGDIREVSHELADIIVEAEKGHIVKLESDSGPVPKNESNPAAKDKAKAEKKAAKDKAKADEDGVI